MRKTENELRVLFEKLDIKANYLGIKYLSHIIELTLEDELRLISISKYLYMDTAKYYKTSIYCVERDIRTVIKIIWNRGDRNFLEKLVGHRLDCCPTNSAFIRCITDYLNREN